MILSDLLWDHGPEPLPPRIRPSTALGISYSPLNAASSGGDGRPPELNWTVWTSNWTLEISGTWLNWIERTSKTSWRVGNWTERTSKASWRVGNWTELKSFELWTRWAQMFTNCSGPANSSWKRSDPACCSSVSAVCDARRNGHPSRRVQLVAIADWRRDPGFEPTARTLDPTRQSWVVTTWLASYCCTTVLVPLCYPSINPVTDRLETSHFGTLACIYMYKKLHFNTSS